MSSTEFETINVGDTVRSYDFAHVGEAEDEGERACYVEGVVECITDPETHPYFTDCARYQVRVTRRVFSGKAVDHAEHVYPPVNGTPSWMGRVMNGVRRVEV